MTCQEAQQWICCQRLFAEGLEEQDAAALADHLAECPHCAEAMDREEAFDAKMLPLMTQVPVPAKLEENILWSMRQAKRAVQRRKVLIASLAAAAALWIAVSYGWYILRPYDLNKLQDMTLLVEKQRVVDRMEGTFDAISPWLKARGIDITLPGKINKRLITSALILEVDGRKVPLLEMNDGASSCRVLLLQRKFFSDQEYQPFQEAWGKASQLIDDGSSPILGWMIVDSGSASNFLFTDDSLPKNGV